MAIPAIPVLIGRAIRRVRSFLGYGQEGLATEVLHIHRVEMSRIERGLIDMRISTLQRHANRMGLQTWQLLKIAEEDEDPAEFSPSVPVKLPSPSLSPSSSKEKACT